jgi:hypothetical protein
VAGQPIELRLAGKLAASQQEASGPAKAPSLNRLMLERDDIGRDRQHGVDFGVWRGVRKASMQRIAMAVKQLSTTSGPY